MYTTAEPFTDRVFLYAISNAAIAYTGGYATRNKYNHTHALSWEGFSTDYAAWVLKARRDGLKVLIYNFADKPLAGRMRLWRLDHGRYRLRVGTDADGDDRMDSPARQETLELMRASPVALELPPRKVTIIELEQAERLDDERLRADLAISSRELRIEGQKIRGVAHNIGSRDVPAFDVALIDPAGKVRVRKTLGPLPAPADLTPQRIAFEFSITPADLLAPPPAKPVSPPATAPAGSGKPAAGWSILLDPDDKIAEITDSNNRLPLPATAAPR